MYYKHDDLNLCRDIDCRFLLNSSTTFDSVSKQQKIQAYNVRNDHLGENPSHTEGHCNFANCQPLSSQFVF